MMCVNYRLFVLKFYLLFSNQFDMMKIKLVALIVAFALCQPIAIFAKGENNKKNSEKVNVVEALETNFQFDVLTNATAELKSKFSPYEKRKIYKDTIIIPSKVRINGYV